MSEKTSAKEGERATSTDDSNSTAAATIQKTTNGSKKFYIRLI